MSSESQARNNDPIRQAMTQTSLFPAWHDAVEYGIDATQRSILFLDVLRKRGNQFMERREKPVPHVLVFDFELILDGRDLDPAVNYGLVRIKPPKGVHIDEAKRPFVVVDPRAGHGPGIGGFKRDSEIGMAMRAGHPCYFIGFTPEPMPGQTIADVCAAEAEFIAEVARRHPKADGKPVVIANCQAGWQTAAVAAVQPDLMGPVIVAGAPLSYWSGISDKNPMGYLGGLLGGTWMSALWGDLGNGKFDGAWLVNNFEQLNPANTYWSKLYNLYSRVDTEKERFLEFEKWWTTFYLLNTEEISAITNELFVGNKLSAGEIVAPDGRVVDLRDIKSPIVCFCSWGDNITPPPQALHWIVDLYENVEEIRARGQTIIYALHDTTGHLGIFVSGSVARKEHSEFTSNIDMIDALPPGLYQAVITRKPESDDGADFAGGDYVMRFEARDISDIRALGEPDKADLDRFEAVARLSEVNEGLYRTIMRPFVRATTNEQSAELLRSLHPQRLPNQLLSDENPWMAPIARLAEAVRAQRHPVGEGNVFWAMQQSFAEQMVEMLDGYRDSRDQMQEQWFNAVYGSPLLQALLGLASQDGAPQKKPHRDEAFDALVAKGRAETLSRIREGGALEAVVRSLLFVAIGGRAVDERSFRALKAICESLPEDQRPSLEQFKQCVREQFTMLLLDEEGALKSLVHLYPEEKKDRTRLYEIVRLSTLAQVDIDAEQAQRLRKIAEMIGVEPGTVRLVSKAAADAA